jgi:hypothetical protein
LNFETPIFVSSFEEPDFLIVEFNCYLCFFSEFGQTILEDTTLERILPRQVLKGSTAAKIASVANELAASANSVNVGNVILNTVLSASLNQIWSMINTQ